MKKYLLVFAILLIVDWILGVLRFSIQPLKTLFNLINFPSSLFFVALETKPSAWWFDRLGTQLINDEVASAILFVLMVSVQALIYCGLLRLLERTASTQSK